MNWCKNSKCYNSSCNHCQNELIFGIVIILSTCSLYYNRHN